jgi:hypothetical protein
MFLRPFPRIQLKSTWKAKCLDWKSLWSKKIGNMQVGTNELKTRRKKDILSPEFGSQKWSASDWNPLLMDSAGRYIVLFLKESPPPSSSSLCLDQDQDNTRDNNNRTKCQPVVFSPPVNSRTLMAEAQVLGSLFPAALMAETRNS